MLIFKSILFVLKKIDVSGNVKFLNVYFLSLHIKCILLKRLNLIKIARANLNRVSRKKNNNSKSIIIIIAVKISSPHSPKKYSALHFFWEKKTPQSIDKLVDSNITTNPNMIPNFSNI